MQYLLLVLAYITKHLVVDFFLQPRELAEGKGTSKVLLTFHTLLHLLTALIMLLVISSTWISIPATVILLAAFGECAAHWLIDYGASWAYHKFKTKPGSYTFWSIVGTDQYLHFLSYLAIVGLLLLL